LSLKTNLNIGLSKKYISQAALAAAGAAVLIGGSLGCETKSWIDPGEVGRYEKTPLIVPILDRLTVGLDSNDAQFSQAREVKPDDLVAGAEDYRLGSNDLVQINVTDLAGPGIQTTETRRVTENGMISMPNLPKPVVVKDLSEYETEVAVKKAYLDAQILADTSTVSVTVVEARNRTFRIGGAIPTPGQYLIEKNNYRLMDAMLQAGQPQTVGSDYIYIIREKSTSAANSPASPGTSPGMGETPATPSNPTGVDPLLPSGSLNKSQPIASINSGVQVILASNLAVSGEFLANQPMDVAPATTPSELPGQTEGRALQIEGAPVMEPADVPTPEIPGDKPMSDAVPFAGPEASGSQTSFAGFNTPEEPTDVEVIRVPLKPLLDGQLRYNIVIRPNDFIVVQNLSVGEYYMGGHVQRTGVYSLSGRTITLKQAIVSAGMFDQVAIPARTDIIRRVGPSQEIFVRVDLEKIFAGLEPDIFLKPNDVVMVGTNAGAPFLAAFRNAFRFTYGFGFLYDRNFFDINAR